MVCFAIFCSDPIDIGSVLRVPGVGGEVTQAADGADAFGEGREHATGSQECQKDTAV